MCLLTLWSLLLVFGFCWGLVGLVGLFGRSVVGLVFVVLCIWIILFVGACRWELWVWSFCVVMVG